MASSSRLSFVNSFGGKHATSAEFRELGAEWVEVAHCCTHSRRFAVRCPLFWVSAAENLLVAACIKRSSLLLAVLSTKTAGELRSLKQVLRGRNPEQWAAYSKAPRMSTAVRHFDPLGAELSELRTGGVLSTKGINKRESATRRHAESDTLPMDEAFLDERSTARLLKMSKEQLDEVKQKERFGGEIADFDGVEYGDEHLDDEALVSGSGSRKMPRDRKRKSEGISKLREAKSLLIEELLGDVDTGDSTAKLMAETTKRSADKLPTVDGKELTETEERELEKFLPKSSRAQMTLRQAILRKYKEKSRESTTASARASAVGADADMASVKSGKSLKSVKSHKSQNSDVLSVAKRKQRLAMESLGGGLPMDGSVAASSVGRAMIRQRLPHSVAKVYRETGAVLARWKCGKLPKAFKILPQLSDWEEVAYLSEPSKWTPHVVLEATKMMSSQAKADVCQRFYNLILLPRVRLEIAQNRKLDFHLYQALRKATFKIGAFLKGFLLPLCMDECRAREAVIIGGVVARKSIPVVHSALAMYKLLELPYSGPCHYLLKVFLNKRYALPHKVLQRLLTHFAAFETDVRHMPVIWHQCLLTFVERYGAHLSASQKLALKPVLKTQFHREITPLVRRSLGLSLKAHAKGSQLTLTGSSMDIDI